MGYLFLASVCINVLFLLRRRRRATKVQALERFYTSLYVPGCGCQACTSLRKYFTVVRNRSR